MANLIKVALLLASCLVICHGHTYHSGQCPNVEPQPDFQMNQFLGIWYVIQKTSTASTCIIYNVTRGEEPGEYRIEQTSQHFALGLTRLRHEYSYTGTLTVPDNDVPAKMKVKFPLSVAGSSTFTVFMTDYHQYAGVFSCQKVTFAHRRSATILSRTKTLDKIYLDKIRSRLANFAVDPFDLSIVNQNDCPKNGSEGFNIHIDPDTFSAANIASVVRSAGDKIASGVETAINAGKKAYNKLTTSNEDAEKVTTESTETMNLRKSERMQHDPNAEWIAF
ncbi:apolipoprotein D-like isoform X1 [Phlebotomus argentipes]|uniref:apolipoprotein D-like isoform X1 n=1 Tax=Phlebotomus argentipes TaxID=94469 RepID=UPI002892DCA8|nr:apolipoprotein D-like isoform X1 [Phlebotomus argentipes]